MPPKNSRSTGALRIAFIISAGVAFALAKPIAACASGDSAISFSEREKTPPPAEISDLS